MKAKAENASPCPWDGKTDPGVDLTAGREDETLDGSPKALVISACYFDRSRINSTIRIFSQNRMAERGESSKKKRKETIKPKPKDPTPSPHVPSPPKKRPRLVTPKKPEVSARLKGLTDEL